MLTTADQRKAAAGNFHHPHPVHYRFTYTLLLGVGLILCIITMSTPIPSTAVSFICSLLLLHLPMFQCPSVESRVIESRAVIVKYTCGLTNTARVESSQELYSLDVNIC